MEPTDVAATAVINDRSLIRLDLAKGGNERGRTVCLAFGPQCNLEASDHLQRAALGP